MSELLMATPDYYAHNTIVMHYAAICFDEACAKGCLKNNANLGRTWISMLWSCS
jgi:hypothetical protein